MLFESAATFRHREAEVLCLESGSDFLDVLFTFTAFF
jgi:hypothetical protein